MNLSIQLDTIDLCYSITDAPRIDKLSVAH